MLSGDATIKQFGIGLAVAVVLDATVVRRLLVPEDGEVNSWKPRWLDRLVPHVSIEGAEFFAERDSLAAPGARTVQPGYGARKMRPR